MKKTKARGDTTCAAPLVLVAPPVAPELVEVGMLRDEVREVEEMVVLAPLEVALVVALLEEELDVMVEELLELDEEVEELPVLVVVDVEDDEVETGGPIPNLGE
jgi:hypothetical protein